MRHQRLEPALRLDGLAAARAFFSGCFEQAEAHKESLLVAHVDEDSRCVHLSRHLGDEAGASFPLRTIIAEAAELGSAGIVLAHNHPSGDPRPSDSDCRATRRLVAAAEALDCTILDHLVFAGAECTSFRKMGLL